MKANELMIGDYFMTPNGIGRIIMIGAHSPVYTNVTGEGEAAIWPKDLQPIPITLEILEKNGWRYNDAPFVQGWEQYGLTIINNRITCGQNVSMKVEFVHELQHSLRLCGIEKEIVL